MKERYTLPIAVYLIVLNDKNEVLLLKRQNTWYMDWYYSLIAWHKEKNENVIDALIRETKEETDIDIDLKNLRFSSVINRKAWDREYIDYFYILENYVWDYKNLEPYKCEYLKFFDLSNLPDNTIDYIKCALLNINSSNYSLIYWW
jgi:ADP-ribose pyrophosphatase YjhB (NUDIX family)